MLSTRTSDAAVRHTLAGCCSRLVCFVVILYSPLPCVHTHLLDPCDKMQAHFKHQITAMLTEAYSHMQATRAAALGSLAALLQTPEGSRAAAAHLAAVWPPLLALLWDGAADVRAAAAPVVGRLGAIAARKPDGTYTGMPAGCVRPGGSELYLLYCSPIALKWKIV